MIGGIFVSLVGFHSCTMAVHYCWSYWRILWTLWCFFVAFSSLILETILSYMWNSSVIISTFLLTENNWLYNAKYLSFHCVFCYFLVYTGIDGTIVYVFWGYCDTFYWGGNWIGSDLMLTSFVIGFISTVRGEDEYGCCWIIEPWVEFIIYDCTEPTGFAIPSAL